MKRLTLILLALLLASCIPLPAQQRQHLVKFLNWDDDTRIQTGTVYTVKYELDTSLADQARYLQIIQKTPISRYVVSAYQCLLPTFPKCEREFKVYVSGNEGTRLLLIASSQLSFAPYNIIDSSGLATIVLNPATSTADESDMHDRLIDAYPNPSGTHIDARIEQVSPEVVLKIIDVSGREYWRYTSYGAGRHSIPFNLSTIPTGTYYLRFEAPESRETKKIIVQH